MSFALQCWSTLPYWEVLLTQWSTEDEGNRKVGGGRHKETSYVLQWNWATDAMESVTFHW